MLMLIAAGASFAGIHLFVAGTRARDVLVARLGEKAYAGLFSLASAALLAWLIWAFVRARTPAVTPFYDERGIAAVLMLVSIVLIVLGVTTVGATGVGGGSKLSQPDAARGIHRITRHPFLWGVALWAAVHLVYNPGAPYLMFFGTFLVVALAGTVSIDAKRNRRYGDLWPAYARMTSNLPFGAIVAGRNRIEVSEIAWWQWLACLATFAALLALHARLFGLPAL